MKKKFSARTLSTAAARAGTRPRRMASATTTSSGTTLALEYDTDTSVTVWPGGQLKPRLDALAGPRVSDPTMLPFRSAVNWPDLLTVVTNVCLLEADGFLPPPLTHS